MGSSKRETMLLTLKTLDHKIFKYEVSDDATVDDLKTRVENDFGQENIYKLIYAGKILKDDNTLKSYNINEKQFIVLMITKPIITKKEEEKKDQGFEETPKATVAPIPVEEISVPESTESLCENKSKFSSDSLDLVPDQPAKDDDIVSTCSESIPSLSLEIDNNAIAITEGAAAAYDVYEDSDISDDDEVKMGLEWIEQEIKKKSDSHFITNKDFSICLDVVMDMEYLADIGNKMKTPEDISAFLDFYFRDKSFLNEVKAAVIERIEDLLAVSPNSKQMEAFLTDLVSIYAQERTRTPIYLNPPTEVSSYHYDSESDDDDEDDIEVIVTAFQRNVDNIVAMGFLREEVEVALRAAFNNPDQAVDYLIGGIPPSAFAPEENPLAFLRNNVEFQHIRYLVQANPDTLQPLLLSFGQKHPELMDTINKNKLSFVRMLHEPDGAKGMADDSSLVVDPSSNTDNSQHHARTSR